MSTNRFLSSESTGNLTGGTTTIYGATIGADNLFASRAIRTDSLKRLVSADLLISDVSTLNSRLVEASIFGGGFQQVSSDEDSVNSTTSFIEKLKLTTPSLPNGTYRISWSVEIKNSNAPSGGQFRVQLDDISLLGEGFNDASLADFISQSGFSYQVALNGIHFIDIDFTANKGTTTIRRVRLEIWRVA